MAQYVPTQREIDDNKSVIGRIVSNLLKKEKEENQLKTPQPPSLEIPDAKTPDDVKLDTGAIMQGGSQAAQDSSTNTVNHSGYYPSTQEQKDSFKEQVKNNPDLNLDSLLELYNKTFKKPELDEKKLSNAALLSAIGDSVVQLGELWAVSKGARIKDRTHSLTKENYHEELQKRKEHADLLRKYEAGQYNAAMKDYIRALDDYWKQQNMIQKDKQFGITAGIRAENYDNLRDYRAEKLKSDREKINAYVKKLQSGGSGKPGGYSKSEKTESNQLILKAMKNKPFIEQLPAELIIPIKDNRGRVIDKKLNLTRQDLIVDLFRQYLNNTIPPTGIPSEYLPNYQGSNTITEPWMDDIMNEYDAEHGYTGSFRINQSGQREPVELAPGSGMLRPEYQNNSQTSSGKKAFR